MTESPVTLSGNAIIKDNKVGDVVSNLYLKTGVITVGTMGANANVGISVLTPVDGLAVSAKLNGADVAKYFSYDDTSFKIVTKNDTLCLEEKKVHSHKLCGDSTCTEHGDIEFLPWEETTTLPKSGNYYLTKNVNLSAVCNVTGDLNLCLNGKTITAPKNERSLVANPGVTLSITDHDNTGKITGGVRNYGGVINVNQGATFNLYGGTLTGNTNVNATSSTGQGGAIYLTEAKDNLAGGVFNMYGGAITGNTAYRGGAVFACKGSTVNVYGGTITGNTANNGGGAIYLATNATFNMAGGEITNNTAATEGGAITVTNSPVTLSGNAIIKDNKAGENASNLYLKAGVITVGTMGTNANIGISALNATDGLAVSAKLNGADVAKYFSSDDTTFEIAIKDDVLCLNVKSTHIHKICNDSACADHADVKFLPWDSATSLPKSGNYYLTKNVNLSAVCNVTGDLNLCLNGKTITAPKNERSLVANPGVTLSITDHDNTGKITDGVRNWGGVINVNQGATFNLFGGTLTGNTNKDATAGDGQGGAVYLSTAKDGLPGGVFNMYGGEISGNTAYRGGAVYMTKSTTFNMYGGTISGNTANNRSGAIFASGATVNIYGGEISGNTGKSSGGAISVSSGAILTLVDGKICGNTGSSGGAIIVEGTNSKMVMCGGEISGNTGSAGGAIYVSTGTTFEMTGGKITGNTAISNSTNYATGGGIHLLRSAAILSGGEISGNTATATTETTVTGGGVQVEGATLTLTGTKISGNKADSGAGVYIRRAVYTEKENGVEVEKLQKPVAYLAGGEISGNIASKNGGGVTNLNAEIEKLELSGNIVIKDNKVGEAVSNLYLQDNIVVTLGEMGANAKVGVRLPSSRLSATGRSAFTAKLNGANVAGYFTSDVEKYEVVSSDDALYLERTSTHIHKICNDSACADHADVKFLPWDGTTSLPKSGNYYLTADVQLNAVRNVTGDLNLCLNGYTITAPANERTFAANTGVTLSVTDCIEIGKITGGVRNYGGVINVNPGAIFNLYGGSLTGNQNAAMDKDSSGRGGAVFLSAAKDGQPGGVFNMYGGSITENKANQGGAVFLNAGSTFNMYGGTISKNSAVTRGGAFANEGKATVNIYGGTISENTAKSGAVARLLHGTTITITGGLISGNTANGSGGAFLLESNGTKMFLRGGKITGNSGTTGGAIFASTNTTFEMTGGEISGNTATSATGGGIQLLRSNVTLAGGEIKDNTAATNGGGVQIEGANVTLTGTKITGNKADNGAGMYIAGTKSGETTYQPSVTLAGGQITGNTATTNGGGVMTKDAAFEKLELSGDLVIKDNIAASKISNLYLSGKAGFTVGTMGANAKVGISAKRVYGSMSAETDTDCTAAFFSDNSALAVVYKDNTVYLQPVDGHAHCLCSDNSAACPDHGTTVFAPWSDPKSLPSTPGNYYLTVDVTLRAVHNVFADINLCLNGHTITAPNNERTFALNPGYVLSVADCTGNGKITGGVRNYGGVINVNQGATFNLYGGNLTGNKNATMDKASKGRGGAVFLTAKKDDVPGGVFNMYGGCISHNEANKGGAVFLNLGSTFNMFGGIITENSAETRGGAVNNDGKCTVNISGGTITKNTAKSGAAFSLANGSTLNITDGVISENTASGSGGMILLESTNTKMTMSGGKLTGGSGSNGAAVYAAKNTIVDITGGEFSDNSTTTGAGGALYLQKATATISGVTFKNNKATKSGGAIILEEQTTLTLTDTTITGNTAKKGGAIFVAHASNLTMTDVVIKNSTASSAGGGILLENTDTKMVMNNCEITENTASTGGGIYASRRTTVDMNGGKITKNTVKKHGGGICMLQSTVNIRGGTISYNKSTNKDAQGAGIKVDGATLNIYSGTINGNLLLHEKNSGGAAIAAYKAIETTNGVEYIYHSKINMYSGTISNHTGRTGGAMQLLTESVFNMYGGVIRDNESKNDGGAAAMYSKSAFNVYGGQIDNNTAGKAGGALYYGKGTTGELRDITATGNSCGTDGGFLHAYGDTTKIVMKNMKVYGNKAEKYAGAVAMMMQSDLDMDDCELYENEANRGGAIYHAHKVTGHVDNTKIYKNTAVEHGGGIYLDVGGDLFYTNVKILDNKAGLNAGGALVRANIEFKDCLIDGNEAGENGGGIATGSAWTYNNTYTGGRADRGKGMILENTVISNNTCGLVGGGAFLKEKNWNEIRNSSFTGNTSGEGGSALFVKDDLKVNGMTVTGNTSKNDGFAVWYDVNKFDGQSYNRCLHEMGGNVIVKDNQGGDMMLCEDVVLGNIAEGYGKDTYFNVTLSDGVLTNRVLGEYDYEGGDLYYTVTYGSRSYTEPEIDTPDTETTDETQSAANVWLYTGVGVFVIAVAAVVLLVLKKKKAAKPATQPQE